MPISDRTEDKDIRPPDLEPMTQGQREYLKVLAGRMGEPDVFHETLTRAEADKRIVALEERLAHERHSGKERLPHT
jgi:hypothetical protein